VATATKREKQRSGGRGTRSQGRVRQGGI
jgi:hypothetical protein